MDAYGGSDACRKIDKTGGEIRFKILPPDGTCLGYRPTDTVMTHLIYLDSRYAKETGFCLENVFNLVKDVIS